MSLVIKGISLPNKCRDCEVWSLCWYEKPVGNGRKINCPLIEAPNLQDWQWIALKKLFEDVPIIVSAAGHKENLMEHEVMSAPIGAREGDENE